MRKTGVSESPDGTAQPAMGACPAPTRRPQPKSDRRLLGFTAPRRSSLMLLPGRAQRMTGAQLFAGFASCVLLQLGFAGYAAQSVSRAFLCANPPTRVLLICCPGAHMSNVHISPLGSCPSWLPLVDPGLEAGQPTAPPPPDAVFAGDALVVVPSARCGIGLLKKQKGTRPIFL
jgi:hypothetical protein